MQAMFAILMKIADNFQITDFEPYKSSAAFDIYLYKSDHQIELAVLREISKPHYHLLGGKSRFYFLDPGVIQLGKCSSDGKQGFLHSLPVEPGSSFLISPRVLHAAGPSSSGHSARLLIMSQENMRQRGENAYPVDTYFLDAVTILDRGQASA